MGVIKECQFYDFNDYSSSKCFFHALRSIFVFISMRENYDEDRKYTCREVMAGLKDNKTARIYSFMLLFRKFVYVTWLIVMSSFDKYFLISFLSICQMIYLFLICSLSPFENKDDNMVEIVNEIFFTFSS